MTKLTGENPTINCSTILQIGICAQPKSVLETDTFHGACRQMASEFFNFSHLLMVTTTMTLYKYTFFQKRMSFEACCGGMFLEL